MQVRTQTLTEILEAFAVGDAMGMPTEFMTRSHIKQTVGSVKNFVDPKLSKHHSDLPCGTITDDTEQNLFLIRAYVEAGKIDEPTTTAALLDWIDTSDAVAKRYIGPSSLKALRAIASGANPKEAGTGGTTCGGLMRTPAAVLCTSTDSGYPKLTEHIQQCLMSTHYTSQALEAACAYGYALQGALRQNSLTEIIQSALEGARIGLTLAPYEACSASSGFRIQYLLKQKLDNDSELLDFLYGAYGTGLESADVCAAVFALFLRYPEDPWKAIRLASEIGGDTDTIAALTGALCTAYRGSHNIPREIVETVAQQNHIDFSSIAVSLSELHKDSN